MAFFDLPLEQLLTYLPDRLEPPDFDHFWAQTIQETEQYPLDAQFSVVDYGLKTMFTYDVAFRGYGGQPVKGWFLHPRDAPGPLPCVVEFIGYGGGRGFPIDWLVWPSAGYATLVMDTRGQGSSWRKGDTPDLDGSSPSYPGFMTKGILDPRTYYYRRVFCDAYRAVETARKHELVDTNRMAVSGGSQGGGISLAISGLVKGLGAVLPDVPFLCAMRRATQITDGFPYGEIAAYCKTHRDQVDAVFQTLAYFDGVNFAARADAPALFSVGLMDEICPPSTVFAAYNHYAAAKQIRIYEYNHHEGGDNFQTLEKIRFLKTLWPD